MSDNIKNNLNSLSSDKIKDCIDTLSKLAGQSSLIADLTDEQRVALLKAAGKLSRPDRDEIRGRNKAIRKNKKKHIVNIEKKARSQTGIRVARTSSIFTAPKQIASDQIKNNDYTELKNPRNCYVCKKEYTKLHFFYDSMCPECAEFNYEKRFQSVSLEGRAALITGSRLKIGYQASLMMLRAGADVIATTRFPVDSAMRFSKEEDYKEWQNRLHIYGLDLRHTPSVELFTSFIEKNYSRLDILINNAAQTVRRPPGFYAHLMQNELMSYNDMPSDVKLLLSEYYSCISQINSFASDKEYEKESELAVSWNGKSPGIGIRHSAKLSQIPYLYDYTVDSDKIFPKGKLDADLQQVDLRETNSWRFKIGEIPTIEMIEIQLVNAVAPFVLCNRLTPMMKRDFTGQKHIVNVSAMEGKFLRFKTNGRHPHTNMAKAALNMLTHTSASDLAKFGIYMNAVDTGWVTDEDPVKLSKLKEELHDFQPPLDIVDGAARVCDPFFHGILTGRHWCGKFLKDYKPIDW